MGCKILKTGYLTLISPLSGKIFLRQGGTCGKSMYQILSIGSSVTKLSMAVRNAENGVVWGG